MPRNGLRKILKSKRVTILNKWNKEDIQRGIDAHIAANQLFTSDLNETIRKKALRKEQTYQRKHMTKRKKLLISVVCSLIVTAAGLFFVIHQATTNSPTEEPAITTTTSSLETALSSELLDKAMKGYSALGNNDFQMMKQYFHSDVQLDERKQTIQFTGDTEPLQTSYFPKVNRRSFKVYPTIEQTANEVYLILQNEYDSFEIHFQRDPLNGDDYRITAIINGN